MDEFEEITAVDVAVGVGEARIQLSVETLVEAEISGVPENFAVENVETGLGVFRLFACLAQVNIGRLNQFLESYN